MSLEEGRKGRMHLNRILTEIAYTRFAGKIVLVDISEQKLSEKSTFHQRTKHIGVMYRICTSICTRCIQEFSYSNHTLLKCSNVSA